LDKTKKERGCPTYYPTQKPGQAERQNNKRAAHAFDVSYSTYHLYFLWNLPFYWVEIQSECFNIFEVAKLCFLHWVI